MQGTIIHRENIWDIGNSLSYSIYLPKGDISRSFVMYFLHGSNSDEKFWFKYYEILDDMIKDGKIEPMAGVSLGAGNSYWVDSIKYGEVESFFINKFIPYVENTYGITNNRENTYITGCSMGGYGALRYSLVYPEFFSKVILLSAAAQHDEPPATSGAVCRGSFGEPFDKVIWNEKNYLKSLKLFDYKPLSLSFFIMAGDDDYNHMEENKILKNNAYLYNMEMQTVMLYQELCRKAHCKNIKAALRIYGGKHDNKLWFKGFKEGLLYLNQDV